MTQDKAQAIADALGGEAHESGGGIWLAIVTLARGSLVVISDEMVCAYASRQAFDGGDAATATVLL